MNGLRISQRSLVFTKGTSSSQSLNLDWSFFHNYEVSIFHCLPDCFQVEPAICLIETPSTIKVNYDASKELTMPNERLWIKLNTWLNDRAGRTYHQHTVTIDFLEEQRAPARAVLYPVVQVQHQKTETIQLKNKEAEKKSEPLDCKVCLQTYSDEIENSLPRILTACGHTFCQTCVTTIQQMSFDRKSVACPFDRRITKVANENLPKNFAIIDLIRDRKEQELTNSMLKATSISEDPEVPCFENSKHEATRYCRSCEVNFCENCFKSVHSSKIHSNHKSTPVPKKGLELPNCPVHPEQLAIYFCQTKNCPAQSPLCCTLCLFNTHNHHDLKTIQEAFEENKKSLIQLVIKLSEKANDVTGMIQKMEKFMDEIPERGNVSSFVELDKECLKRGKVEMEHDLGLIMETKQNVEMTLKSNSTWLVQEMIEMGKAMCSLEVGKGENFNFRDFLNKRPATKTPSPTVLWVPPNPSAPPVTPPPPPPPPPRRTCSGHWIFRHTAC